MKKQTNKQANINKNNIHASVCLARTCIQYLSFYGQDVNDMYYILFEK